MVKPRRPFGPDPAHLVRLGLPTFFAGLAPAHTLSAGAGFALLGILPTSGPFFSAIFHVINLIKKRVIFITCGKSDNFREFFSDRKIGFKLLVQFCQARRADSSSIGMTAKFRNFPVKTDNQSLKNR